MKQLREKKIKLGIGREKTQHRSERSIRRQNAKRVISSAKQKKQKECASDLNDPKQQNEIFQIAKQMVKDMI